jgi:hypothetical protein
MPYTIRHDQEAMDVARRSIQTHLATETDAGKITELVELQTQAEARIQGYYDQHGSDDTTFYANQQVEQWVAGKLADIYP